MQFLENVELWIIELCLDPKKKAFRWEEKIIGIANGPVTVDTVALSISNLRINGKDCEFSVNNEKQNPKVSESSSKNSQTT